MENQDIVCALCELNTTSHSNPNYLMKLGNLHLLKGPWFEKWPGHVMIVYAPDHIEEQTDIPMEARAEVFENILQVEDAIRKVCRTYRINFAKFGNVATHLHWHLIPRFPEERFLQKCPWEILAEVDLYTKQGPRDCDAFYIGILAEILRRK